MHRNAQAVQEAAAALGLSVEIREFPDGTRTAEDAAAAVGVTVGQIVKSLIFAVGDPGTRASGSSGEVVLALVSGVNQLDEHKLAQAAGASGAWRVDADTVRTATGFAVGGVPPFGHAQPLRAFIDADLLNYDEIWAAAGTPRHVFALAPAALQSATTAPAVDLARR